MSLKMMCLAIVAAAYAYGVPAAVAVTPHARVQSKAKKVCLPPYWAGLLAGSSTDAEVRRLLGDGYETERRGETVRLFTNPSRSATLIVQFGTDRIVTSVDLWAGVEAGLSPSSVEKMVSTFLRSNDGIGNWGQIHLGDTKAVVEANLGTPTQARTEDNLLLWTYESACACELSTGLVFRFQGGRLVSFGVWALNG